MLIDDVEGRRRWRRAKTFQFPCQLRARRKIQGFQDVIRIARIVCRAFPHAKFAIRSIPVRRTRIELDVD
jgi:hypothetical protein